MRRSASGGAWWLSPGPAAFVALGPMVLAIFVCVHQLTCHDVLHGVVVRGEGPGIASAIALAKGVFAYKQYPLTEPPGMTILMLPFGFLINASGPDSVVPLARIVTEAVTVLSVYLAGLVARPYGVPAALLAGVFTATYGFSFLSTGGVTDGPYILFFTLLAAALAFQEGDVAEGPRILLAGLFMGFACTIKPWAFIPALVLVACAVLSDVRAGGRIGRLVGGLVAGVALPCIPFLVESPGNFWRDVVLTELPGSGAETAGRKLADVFGLGSATGFTSPDTTAVTIAIVVAVAIAIVALLGIRRSTPYDWFVSVTALAVLLVVFLPGSMAEQYGEFALPLVAIGVATTATRLVALASVAWEEHRPRSIGSIATGIAIVMIGCAVVVAAEAAPASSRYAAGYANAHGLRADTIIDKTVPAGTCAMSDQPMLLVLAQRYRVDPPSCPVGADPGAPSAIAREAGDPGQAVAQWDSWLSSARAFVTLRVNGLPGRSRRYLRSHYTLVARGDGVIVFSHH